VFEISVDPLRKKLNVFHVKTQFVPRSKHSVSVIKTSDLMLCRAQVSVCSEIHIRRINTLCGQNLKFFKVKPVST
jgi:hypothetical protein